MSRIDELFDFLIKGAKYNENRVVACVGEEAKQFLNLCQQRGFRWLSGALASEVTYFDGVHPRYISGFRFARQTALEYRLIISSRASEEAEVVYFAEYLDQQTDQVDESALLSILSAQS